MPHYREIAFIATILLNICTYVRHIRNTYSVSSYSKHILDQMIKYKCVKNIEYKVDSITIKRISVWSGNAVFSESTYKYNRKTLEDKAKLSLFLS